MPKRVTGPAPLVYQDVCRVPNCPEPNSDEWHRCFVCGKAQGDHAHVESRARAPKRKRDPKNIVFLCRQHHYLVDQTLQAGHAIKPFPDGTLHYLYWTIAPRKNLCDKVIAEGGRSRSTSVSSPKALAEAPASLGGLVECSQPHQDGAQAVAVIIPEAMPVAPYESMSDEELAALYQQADELQGQAFVRKCAIIAEWRRRHQQVWGDSWTNKPLQFLQPAPSRRELQALANLGEIFKDSLMAEYAGEISSSRALRNYIGFKSLEAGRQAMEVAVQHVADYGEIPSRKALAHLLGEEEEQQTTCEHEWGQCCRKCREWREP